MKKALLVATLLGSSVIFAACSHDKQPTVEVNVEQPAAASPMEENTSEVQIINVEAGSFYYKPNTITVKKGQKVKIAMTSKDMMHDFTVDELNVKMPVTVAGKTGEVEFTADKVGTFEFYCSVGQHRKNGQVGTLVVTE